METQPLSRRDVEALIVKRSWSHPEFRAEFLADPKATIEKYSGEKLPVDFTVTASAEDDQTIYFVIPTRPANADELSDEDLEKVAGGIDLFTIMGFTLIFAGAGAAAAASATKQKGGW